MKIPKILFLFFAVVILNSCENACDVKDDINQLTLERSGLQKDVFSLSQQKDGISSQILLLDEELKERNIYKSGKVPKYIIKFHLRQTHMSLDIGKHIKDAMNAIDFEMPVDKEFYDNVSKGTHIVDEFRSGSLFIEGSFGNWEMTVADKEIR